MSLKDHFYSFAMGAFAGGVATAAGTVAERFLPGVGQVVGIGFGVCTGTVARTSFDDFFQPAGVPTFQYKEDSFALGTAAGIYAALVGCKLATDPQTPPAVPEQSAPAIEQQKPASPLPEGATIYQSTSGPVTIPKGLKFG